jgi:hypothetical protein
MRKFILITAMVLASATAQAGQSRSLTMASNDDQAIVGQQPAASEVTNPSDVKSTEAAKPSETAAPAEAAKPVDAPKYVERPPAVEPAAEPAKTSPEKSSQVVKAEKPKHRRETTEARVIYELHRHGIYW